MLGIADPWPTEKVILGLLFILALFGAVRFTIFTFEECRNDVRRLFPEPGGFRFSIIRKASSVIFVARGIPASGGIAYGKVTLTYAAAMERVSRGESIVFVLNGSESDKMPGIIAAKAVIMLTEPTTSRFAEVARRRGIPCVCKAELQVDVTQGTIVAGQNVFKEGDLFCVDGNDGCIRAELMPEAA